MITIDEIPSPMPRKKKAENDRNVYNGKGKITVCTNLSKNEAYQVLCVLLPKKIEQNL